MSTDVTLERPVRAESHLPALSYSVSAPVTIIERRSNWRIVDWKELNEYRDLFAFLVWRGIKIRYAQSTLGIGWAVIQPLVSTIVFTIIFGKLAKVETDGVPYALLSLSGLVPWTFFSNALNEGTQSLITNANMISKVYFPRIVLPLAAVAGRLVDFAISLGLLMVLMVYYQALPASGAALLVLPLLILMMVVAAAGVSMWMTALAIQYRDVKHAMSFVVQILMYAAPVVYPTSLIPKQYQALYAINPMVGVIEGFRAVFFGVGGIPWSWLGIGAVTAIVTCTTGAIYFHRKERLFADVA